MTLGPGVPPPRRRYRGRQPDESYLFKLRYARLRSEGFTVDEADDIARGVISTPIMLRGRRIRRRWHAGLVRHYPKLTKKQLEDAVDVLYDEADWATYYTQFYPEGYSLRYWSEE